MIVCFEGKSIPWEPVYKIVGLGSIIGCYIFNNLVDFHSVKIWLSEGGEWQTVNSIQDL